MACLVDARYYKFYEQLILYHTAYYCPFDLLLNQCCIIWAPLAYYSIRPGQGRAAYVVSFERWFYALHAHTRSYGVTFAPSHGKFNISNPAAHILGNIFIIWAPLAYYSIHPGQGRTINMVSLERCGHPLHANTRSYWVTLVRLHGKLNNNNYC